ncbi:MAG: FAD-dependent oxidoreductase [Planctomycetota bacterium]
MEAVPGVSGATRYDVVVLGGGAAGIGAAVGAARGGARTLLVERYGFLGGMATAGMVGTICGLYRSGDGPPRRVNGASFAAEFSRALEERRGGQPVTRMGKTYVLPYTPPTFARLADDVTAAEASLDVHQHTHLSSVAVSGRRFEAVRLVGPNGAVEIEGGAFVDATGDAIATLLAGAEVETVPVAERQLPSIVFHLQGVTGVKERGARVALLRQVAGAEKRGDLPPGCSNLALRRSHRSGELTMKIALSGVGEGREGTPPWTVAEREARFRVEALATFLRERVDGFGESWVSHLAPQLGVRESRRVVGRYRLTRDDVLTARRFDDAIAEGAWPIELWNDGEFGPTLEYLEAGESYTLPRRAFELREFDNAFGVGRCMSGTHEALGSARVIGTGLDAGFAVGKLAAEVAGTDRDSRKGAIT